MAFSSILIPQLSEPESDIQIDLSSSSNIASIVVVSVAFGALVCGSLMDTFGRVRLSTMICVPFVVAWLLIALSRNLFMIYTARILSGFCGGLTTVALVYVSEISSPEYRGMLLCLNSVAVSLGILITYLLNVYFKWRTIGYIFAVSALLTFFIVSRLPESPSWIVSMRKKRKNSDALASYEWIYRRHHLSSFYYHQLVDNEKLKRNHLESLEKKEEVKSILKLSQESKVYKPLIILLFMFLFQQLSGCYILIFYTINIFRNLSLNFTEKINENMALMLLGTLRLIMSVIASGASRKCHRKTLLYISGLGMMIFIFIAAILVQNTDGSTQNFLSSQTSMNHTTINDDNGSYNEVYLLISILCYNSFSALGVMILPWTLISELYPIEVKGKMGGLTVAIAYVLMFSVVKVFPFFFNLYNIETMFYLFSASSLAFCAFVYRFLPETYGKSLIDIQNYFVTVKQ
ncbi:CLUMA_CG018168, isoform A [Clunio marinus]|uniref:CLUMA_CG018168, isoform A n=1 Tax=Clunio marinus TaxID=568069 RepID=A0A1J1J3J9_9DIPT|nr:CLUMA_CG018168, isoform A [Clunio marinus]